VRLLVLVLGLVLLAGCSSPDDGAFVFGGTGGRTTITYDPPDTRSALPAITGESLLEPGRTLSSQDYRGQVVVLNIWGSWCGPCRAEAPYFAKVAKETEAKGQDVAFVGLNARDANKGAAIAFEKDYGVTYPSIYDPTSKLIVNGFPKGSLNPQAIPSTIVLDRDGKIAARSLKALDDKKLREMIDPLIAEK
jgi:thiol-disulfide isomerase/thioredoxin